METQKQLGQYDDTIELKAIVRVKKQRVADLLCSALEGGSNYWYRIEKFVKPKPKHLKPHTGTGGIFRHVDYPLCKGGAIIVSDHHGADGGIEVHTRVDLEQIINGLELMCTLYPRHYSNWLTEKDDAETGDVFLQLCVLGDLVYG